jgi:hypothetical protein
MVRVCERIRDVKERGRESRALFELHDTSNVI